MALSFKSQLRKAYKAAKRELNDLLIEQQKMEKDLVTARQALQSLGTLCEAVGIKVESAEASYLLQKSALGDEVRSILVGNYPAFTRPNQVVAELERIGHDLSKLSNPQASVQMILKRMVENGEAQEVTFPEDGKKVYRIPRNQDDTAAPVFDIEIADVPQRGRMFKLSDLLGSEIDPEKLPEEVRATLHGTMAKRGGKYQSRFQSRFKSRLPSPRPASVENYTPAGRALAELEKESKKK